MAKRIMGKSSGATVNDDDGSVRLIPMYADEFHSIGRRERALKETEIVTLNFVRDGLIECHRDTTRLWKRISDDLGLDFYNTEITAQFDVAGGARLIIKPRPLQAEDNPTTQVIEPHEEKL